MDFKSIHIIINPAAGQEEPILSYLNSTFHDSDISWDVSVTKGEGDGAAIADKYLGKVDVIAVYGGDGSITEVARVLQGTTTPLAIIPGGTANVLSKELGIPQDTKDAIELLINGKSEIRQMDVGFANGELFLIRLNFGIMADMILEASRQLKDKLGQLAYGLTAVQTIIRSDAHQYSLKIDGEDITKEAAALTITNCGSIGIGEYSFAPDISVSDGLLDVILLYKADLVSVLRVAGATLLKKDPEVLEHWRAREVEIRLVSTEKFILDDAERESAFIHIEVMANALHVVVPAS